MALTEASLGLSSAQLLPQVRAFFDGRGFAEAAQLTDAVQDRLSGGTRGVLEACFLLTNDYSASRHNLHADLARPYVAGNTRVRETCQHIRFLEHWVDIRLSVCASLAYASRLQDLRVLVLDDNPGDQFGSLNALVSRLLLRGSSPPEILSPFDNGVTEPALRWLANYQALRRAATAPAQRAQVTAPLDILVARAAEADVVLVDQFIRMPHSGRDEMLGPHLIRGLRRFLRDLGRPVPEFVALSRTDDPRVIQAALRAGAREYILKSRFVSLPAVLARLSNRVSAKSPHRNFRELYALPAETIGLLRSARVPQVPYHIVASTRPGESKVVDIDPPSPDWIQLLEEVPKPDLHVHAGSVMSREFLALASLVMLTRPNGDTQQAAVGTLEPFLLARRDQALELVDLLHAILANDGREPEAITFAHSGLQVAPIPRLEDSPDLGRAPAGSGRWIDRWGALCRRHLEKCLNAQAVSPLHSRELRATLHRELGVRDHLDRGDAAKAVARKSNLDLAMFMLRHSEEITIAGQRRLLRLYDWRLEDLIRVYLLALASRYPGGKLEILSSESDPLPSVDLLRYFASNRPEACLDSDLDAIRHLGRLFFHPDGQLACPAFRGSGWTWNDAWSATPPIRVDLSWSPRKAQDCQPIEFTDDPIGFTLATGTRSENLQEYLLGCEFAGAEHLRHPFLVQVYCRQVVFDWIEQGVVYSELKASPDGYVFPEIDFDYAAAAQCFVAAFSGAQKEALSAYRGVDGPGEWAAAILGSRYRFTELRSLFGTRALPTQHDCSPVRRRLPCKVSLVFVGKRHKALREMILEAAAAAVLRPAGDSPVRSPTEFVDHEFAACRVVGFDLAGPEDGNPPGGYAAEFGRLSRLHVPITVHAGENAGPQFIEDAILTLGASRIGHGLSLAEDRRLVARVRDERIAIELCPVCNHQTSRFHAPTDGGSAPRRQYPLEDYLGAGLYVSINTDNPLISDTNILREYFQASYAISGGLTLWEALRLVRMGLVTSFLTLHERKHLLSLVGEHIFDLFNDEDVLRRLRHLATTSPPGSRIAPVSAT